MFLLPSALTATKLVRRGLVLEALAGYLFDNLSGGAEFHSEIGPPVNFVVGWIGESV